MWILELMDRNRFLSIFMTVAAILFAACSDEAIVGSVNDELVHMTIEANTVSTRTALAEDGTTVQWSVEDEIAVYDFQTSKHNFVSQVASDGHTTFSGKITAKSPRFTAVYPYSLAAENCTSDATISVSIPSTQYATLGGFPTDGEVCANISVAKGERNLDGSPASITFHNVCQMLRFTIPPYAEGQISRIQFTAPTAIAGKLSIDYSGDKPVTSIASTGSKVITVLPPRRTSTFTAGTYYILTAPVSLAGFSMTSACGSKTYSLASVSTFGGQAGRVYNLGCIDLVNTPLITDCHHIYDDKNELVGTTLTVAGAPIVGQPWSMEIKNGSKVVRSLSITGDSQTSDETDSSWPYIPAGNYTVEYTYITSNGKRITTALPTSLTVPAPTLTLSVDAYTAHSKYEEGNISGANECDRLTVYSPTAHLSVVSSLINNSNYSLSYQRTINGQSTTSTDKTNSPSWANYTNIPVSESLHTLSVTANFAGTQVSGTKQVRITGLPANFTPPTEATGWTNDKGTVNFNNDHVRLGNYSLSQPHRIKNASWFNIPSGTRIALDYDIVLHRAAVNTTANVKMGDQQIVECTDSKYNNDVHNTGITQATLSANVSSVTCEGSYGSGATCTKVYKLYFKYGTK